MSRLTKRNNKGYAGIKGYHGLLTSYCYECTEELEDGIYLLEDALNKLAEYEDLEEQGLLLRLPCKVGDTVYLVHACGRSNIDGRIIRVIEEKAFSEHWLRDIGKTVFLTYGEAVAKLKEMEE